MLGAGITEALGEESRRARAFSLASVHRLVGLVGFLRDADDRGRCPGRSSSTGHSGSRARAVPDSCLQTEPRSLTTVRSSVPPWSAALGVALIWGVNVPVMKTALAGLPPFAFNALRLSFSALALALVDRIENRGRAPAPIPWGTVVGLALLTSLVYQVLFITGIDRTSASHAGFLIASGPMWTALLARTAGVEILSRRAWLGLAVAFAGTSLVAAATRAGGSATLLGNVLVLLATMTWALGTVWSRPVLERFPAT